MTNHVPIPEGFVVEPFFMDPKTDFLIESGKLLQPGMVVLIENHLNREFRPYEEDENPYIRRNRMVQNRWCRIVSFSKEHDIIKLVVEYEDGAQVVRTYNESYAWFVKKNNLPDG